MQKNKHTMKSETKNEIETTPKPHSALTIRDKISSDKFLAEIAKALPSHLTAERFARVALSSLTRTPKLTECDQASLFSALLTLSQLGIEPDGRRAHLIPFENRKKGIVECQLIIDYKGLVELAMRSGLVSYIHADIVCDADEFLFDRGELKTHRINYREERGAMFAAYSLCRFKDGTEKCEVLSKREVDGIKARSRSGTSGPWVTDYNEMAKKTAFRRLSKWLPISPEFRDAIEADSDAAEENRFDAAKPVKSSPSFTIPTAPALFKEPPAPAPEPESASEEAAPAAVTVAADPAASLAEYLKTNGVSFDDFIGWMRTTGRLTKATEVLSLDDLDQKAVEHLLADTTSLAKCVRIYGGAQ